MEDYKEWFKREKNTSYNVKMTVMVVSMLLMLLFWGIGAYVIYGLFTSTNPLSSNVAGTIAFSLANGFMSGILIAVFLGIGFLFLKLALYTEQTFYSDKNQRVYAKDQGFKTMDSYNEACARQQDEYDEACYKQKNELK
jgi:ABC-type uncharacterized transport system permease subunit